VNRTQLFAIALALGLSALARGSETSRSLTIAAFLGSAQPEIAESRVYGDLQMLEKLIAACMSRQGIVYIPHPTIPENSEPQLSPTEFAAVYGFGIVRPASQPDLDPIVNPNHALIVRLSPGERAEYFRALYGSADAATHDTPEGGCHGAANHAVYGPRDQVWASLRPELEQMAREIRRDARSAALDAIWEECMGAGTTGIRTRADLERYLLDLGSRAEALYNASAREREQLAGEERSVAVRVLQCDEMVRDRRETIQAEYESRFVEANVADLMELRYELDRHRGSEP
jgi:hypothetical protein